MAGASRRFAVGLFDLGKMSALWEHVQPRLAPSAGVVYPPAALFPADPASNGLPVGPQIIGPAFSDLRTILLAQRLGQMGIGFTPPKGYDCER
jgi:Asp-tRNA(Asn)/Glu-tRNA(Gln) amidotransferase A subunit family amidase